MTYFKFDLGVMALALMGCSYSFEVTSQRTSLENQVIGTYKELDDDLVLISSVRAVDSSGNVKAKPKLSTLQERALKAKQNQEFNRDDIDELKKSQILGEANDGKLFFLLGSVVKTNNIPKSQGSLGQVLLREENRDRAVVWQRIIEVNEDLEHKDLAKVQKTYAKIKRKEARAGDWIQHEDGKWQRKSVNLEPKD